jgi:DNA-binding winged helix-turn-helix (wHTH) protein
MTCRFNEFELDRDNFRLLRERQPVAIEPLAFDLLAYLIEHRTRVVTRDELLQKLWAGKVVSDAALAARLMDARGRRSRSIRIAPTRTA